METRFTKERRPDDLGRGRPSGTDGIPKTHPNQQSLSKCKPTPQQNWKFHFLRSEDRCRRHRHRVGRFLRHLQANTTRDTEYRQQNWKHCFLRSEDRSAKQSNNFTIEIRKKGALKRPHRISSSAGFCRLIVCFYLGEVVCIFLTYHSDFGLFESHHSF